MDVNKELCTRRRDLEIQFIEKDASSGEIISRCIFLPIRKVALVLAFLALRGVGRGRTHSDVRGRLRDVSVIVSDESKSTYEQCEAYHRY